MKFAGIAIAVMAALQSTPSPNMRISIQEKNIAATCFKKGEVIDGMNKICFYDCLGSTAAITVKSFQLCPLNIKN